MRCAFVAGSAAVGVALLPATLVPGVAVALPQTGVGDTSCHVVSDYVTTSPSFYALFMAYLEGYAAGEKTSAAPGADESDAAALMAEVVAYCKERPSADFKSAVAAVTKK